MDMRYEAAPMGAQAEMPEPTIQVVQKVLFVSAIERSALVASFSCPSIAGTSLSAVSPDYTLIGGTA
jgi:hypothetical protein